MRLSFWEKSAVEQKRDIIVIGAGIVGLAAAIELKKRRSSLQVTVIDQQLMGGAASTRNAGFACFGSVSEIISDISIYGEEATLELVQKRIRGIRLMRDRYGDHNIGYIPSGGYETFKSKDDFEQYINEVASINQWLGEDIYQVCETPHPLKTYSRCIFNQYEGQIHTGLFYNALLTEAYEHRIEVLRGIEVERIDEDQLVIHGHLEKDHVQMKAGHIVVATNAMTNRLLPQLDIQAVRNQVIVTNRLKSHGLKGCFHQDRGYIYYRDIEDRILIGGARHLYAEEETSDFGDNHDNREYLLDFLRRYVAPEACTVSIEYAWSGILSGGVHRMPIVEKINDHITVAARLGGMGVAIGIEVGMEAATKTIESSLDT